LNVPPSFALPTSTFPHSHASNISGYGGTETAPAVAALSVGQKVQVQGLKSKPEVNGKEAVVKAAW